MNKAIYISAIVVAVITVSCGKKSQRNVDPEFSSYVEEFEKSLGYQIDFPVQFGDLSGVKAGTPGNKVVGLCSYDENGVTIDTAAWQWLGNVYREVLVYHELGHCALYRGHTEVLNSDSQPVSIMNPTVNSISESYYTNHRTAYIQELFNNRSTLKRIITGIKTAIDEI